MFKLLSDGLSKCIKPIEFAESCNIHPYDRITNKNQTQNTSNQLNLAKVVTFTHMIESLANEPN